MGSELGQDQDNVPVYRRDTAFDLHRQSHRELQSPVTEGNQEPQPVPHRHSSAETALSGNTGSCGEMDYEAAKLVREPGSVIHPFRGEDSGVSMKWNGGCLQTIDTPRMNGAPSPRTNDST